MAVSLFSFFREERVGCIRESSSWREPPTPPVSASLRRSTLPTARKRSREEGCAARAALGEAISSKRSPPLVVSASSPLPPLRAAKWRGGVGGGGCFSERDSWRVPLTRPTSRSLSSLRERCCARRWARIRATRWLRQATSPAKERRGEPHSLIQLPSKLGYCVRIGESFRPLLS
jgi:hypothetical protein